MMLTAAAPADVVEAYVLSLVPMATLVGPNFKSSGPTVNQHVELPSLGNNVLTVHGATPQFLVHNPTHRPQKRR